MQGVGRLGQQPLPSCADPLVALRAQEQVLRRKLEAAERGNIVE